MNAIDRSFDKKINFLGEKISYQGEAVSAPLPILARDYSILKLKYTVEKIRLKQLIKDKALFDVLRPHVENLLSMAEKQEELYRKYLIVPQEAKGFYQDMRLYQTWLNQTSTTYSPDFYKTSGLSRTIRDNIVPINRIRLLCVRFYQVLLALVPLVQDLYSYAFYIDGLRFCIGSLMSAQAWLFFYPRLLANVINGSKHLFFPETEEERNLGFFTRLGIQQQRRWFELIFDSVWCLTGAIAVFYMVGNFARMFILCQIAQQTVEFFLVFFRTRFDVQEVDQLIAQFRDLLRQPGLEKEDKLAFEAYIKVLEQQKAFLYTRYSEEVIGSTLLLLSMLLLVPYFTNPWILLAGRMGMLLMSLVRFATRDYVQQQKPDENIKVFLQRPPERVPLRSFESAPEAAPLGYLESSEGSFADGFDSVPCLI